MKKNIIIASIIALTLPLVSYATLDGLQQFLSAIKTMITSYVIPIAFGLAIVFFFWGMAQFILHDAGNDKTREDGKKKMLWGIIALFVMASIMGIIQFIGSSLGISSTGSSPCIVGSPSDGCSGD
jgi:hypothetical protein